MTNEQAKTKLYEMADKLDEWSQIFRAAAVAIQLTDQILSLPDCNDCQRQGCEYKPRVGENVRNNCPLWKGSAV